MSVILDSEKARQIIEDAKAGGLAAYTDVEFIVSTVQSNSGEWFVGLVPIFPGGIVTGFFPLHIEMALNIHEAIAVAISQITPEQEKH